MRLRSFFLFFPVTVIVFFSAKIKMICSESICSGFSYISEKRHRCSPATGATPPSLQRSQGQRWNRWSEFSDQSDLDAVWGFCWAQSWTNLRKTGEKWENVLSRRLFSTSETPGVSHPDRDALQTLRQKVSPGNEEARRSGLSDPTPERVSLEPPRWQAERRGLLRNRTGLKQNKQNIRDVPASIKHVKVFMCSNN